MHLKPVALGVTSGLFCGVGWLLFMVVSLLSGYAKDAIMQFGPLHPWFSYTYLGALWMGVLHFVVLFVLGYLFALVYNALAK